MATSMPVVTPHNPQLVTGQEQVRESGLLHEEEQTIISAIVQPYRTQWSTNRMARLPSWLKNTEFYKGNQVLSWDPKTRTWFDAVAWYQNGQGNQDHDNTYLTRYVNNLTQSLGTSFIGALARGIPQAVIRPQDADNLSDATTAKAAQEAITIIERMNHIRKMVRQEAQYLYLYGSYFKWTRFVIDGSWAGMKDAEPEFSDKDMQVSQDRFHCMSCGTDTPAGVASEQAPQCSNCTAQLKPEDFFPGETESMPVMVPGKDEGEPNGMVKWTLYSPLQIDADPTAKSPKESALLALDMETDVADLRAAYPAMLDEIKEGTESATDPNTSYARLVRTLVFASTSSGQSADILNERVTASYVWVQPRAYYKLTDVALIKKLQELFPKGLKLVMCGQTVLSITPAVLEREWTSCTLHEGLGLYPPSIADNVVPYNERFNDISNILDDWMERCSTGLMVADVRRLDQTQMDGKALLPGIINGVYTKGESGGISDILQHYEFKIDSNIFNYLDRLWSFCQLIAGIPPQVFGGGTQEGVETAKGQQQMLDQALGKLGIYWDNVKEEHAMAAQNAIECLQANMEYTGDLRNVIEENGSEFRNNYIHMDEMKGKVRIYPDTDEGLPMSPEQKREWWNNAVKMATDEHPLYKAFMMDPLNQETAMAYAGASEGVIPGAAQRSKTQQDIQKLLSSKPTPKMGPNGQPVLDDDGTPLLMPSFDPNKWTEDYMILKEEVEHFCQENSDVRQSNPMGWQNIIAFYRLACQYETEVKMSQAKMELAVAQASKPAPPGMPPDAQRATQELARVSTDAVDNLVRLSKLPPLGKTQSITGQVAASKEIVDAAEKLLKT